MNNVVGRLSLDTKTLDWLRVTSPLGGRAMTFLIDAGVATFCVLPLLLTRHLPLVDLPNHLARQYIIRGLAESQYLQQFYYLRLELVPNLGFDGFLFVFGNFMPIDLAVRTFCIVTILTLFFGTRVINLHFSEGRSRLYRIAPLLCYGGPFQYGFLSFCFGIGLALLTFGAYLRLRRAALPWLVLGFAPAAFLLLLCHLVAFCLFAAAVGACTLAEALGSGGWTGATARRVLNAQWRAACWLVPPFALFLLFSPTFGAGYSMRFSTLREKLESAAAITLFSAPGLELALLVLAAGGLGVALLARRVRLSREGLAILAAQGALWLALPRVAMAGGFIDYRVPWAISFFLLASLVPMPRRDRLDLTLGVLFGGLVTLRIASICVFWLSWEPILAAIDQALTTLPLGTRLMVVRGHPASASLGRRPPLDHVAAYAVARREAYEPDMFADISGQILHLQPHYAHPWSSTPASLDRLPSKTDYLLVLRPTLARLAPDLPLFCVAAGSDFALFRADPSGQARIGTTPLSTATCSGSTSSGPAQGQ